MDSIVLMGVLRKALLGVRGVRNAKNGLGIITQMGQKSDQNGARARANLANKFGEDGNSFWKEKL